jgi:hypothetical protein
MVSSLNLKYLPKERVWFSPSSDNGFEIVVPGDEQAPEPARLQLADWVVERISEIRRLAEDLLNANVDRKVLGNTEWWFEGFEFGRLSSDPPAEFDALFTTDEGGNWNDSRLWFVRFTVAGEGSSRHAIPVRFQTSGEHAQPGPRADRRGFAF